MRPIQLILVSIFGILAIYLEFRSIKESTVFGGNLFDAVPLIVLCILTFVYLFKNNSQYNEAGDIRSFLPFAIGVLFALIVFGHMLLRSHYDNSPTVFTATNFDIGNDGGFSLEFQENHHVKGLKIDHFSNTNYWGTYKQKGDTVILNISLDFKMGRKAIVQDSLLRFIDDTVKFYISRY